MLHPAAGDTAVVMLAPFGYEAAASHRTYTHLAGQIADAGLPVLRFDYPGTGDSPGDELNRELVASRCKAAADACRFLREQGNIRHVVLLGFRLGATIALLSADQCDATSLVLIEPVLSGSQWLQQLETLHTIAGVRDSKTKRRVDGGGREFLGSSMSVASYEAIKSLSIDGAQLFVSTRVLMFHSSHSPGATDLAKQWSKRGLFVDDRPFTGFAAMIANPASARVPTKSLAGIVSWLQPYGQAEGAAAFHSEPVSVSARGYKEQPVLFGKKEPKLGILCEPTGLKKPGPALILVNSAGVSQAGLGRQNVDLARHLARSGFASFRIDTAGIGEGAETDARQNIGEAIDWLDENGIKNPGLVGIAGSGRVAFQTALSDKRLSALLLVNMDNFNWSAEDQPAYLHASAEGGNETATHRAGSWWRSPGANAFSFLSGKSGKTTVTVRQALKAALDRGMRISLVYAQDDKGIEAMTAHIGAKGRLLRDYHNFDVRIVCPASREFDNGVDRAKLNPLVETFAQSVEVSRLRDLTVSQTNQPEILPGLNSPEHGPKVWSL